MIGIVWENTPAEKIGLSQDCEIVSINNITFKNKTSCEIERLLLPEFAKDKIRIKFVKNGVTKIAEVGKIR